MIEVNGLRKQYGDLLAVDDLSFTAVPGSVFGLLGPNGAGKSTTIGCISGLIKPGAGSVRVLGYNVVTEGPASRRKVGVVPQELALYEDLSTKENIMYWGAAYGLRGAELKRKAGDALEITGLVDRAGSRAGTLSGGLKRRLNFACGIVHSPEVLLLDEPTVGVDPQSRVHLLDLVRALAKNGATVLYTTHYMEEAQNLCDNLAIIDHGKIIAEGTLNELRAILGERDVLRVTGSFEPARVGEALKSVDDIEIVQSEETIITLTTPRGSEKLSRVLEELANAGFVVRDTTLTQPSLESLFIKLTGKELRE